MCGNLVLTLSLNSYREFDMISKFKNEGHLLQRKWVKKISPGWNCERESIRFIRIILYRVIHQACLLPFDSLIMLMHLSKFYYLKFLGEPLFKWLYYYTIYKPLIILSQLAFQFLKWVGTTIIYCKLLSRWFFLKIFM